MLMLLSTLTLALAQEKDETEEGEETPPSIEEEVEDWTYYEGLFDLYLDPESGDLSMVIDAEDLGKSTSTLSRRRTVSWRLDIFVVVIAVKWSFELKNRTTKLSSFKKI